MADTIAKLIFQADTKELEKANDLLKDIAKSSVGAENAASGQVKTSKKATDALKTETKASNKNNTSKKKNTKATDQVSKASTKMAVRMRNAANATATLTGPLNGLSGRLSFIATGLGRVGFAALAGGAAFAGLALATAKSLSIFVEYEREMFKLEAVLKSTGNAAGFNSNQLDEMAVQGARATLASATDIRQAQAVLLTFKNIQGDVFRETVLLSQDVASIMGGSASSAAKQLAKALEDPTRNLSSLTKAGVTFSEAEMNKIKILQKSNKLQEAQAIIVERIKGQLGGAGAGGGLVAATDLLGDNLTQLGVIFAESSGMAKGFEVVINAIAKSIGALNDKLTLSPLEKIADLQRRINIEKQNASLSEKGQDPNGRSQKRIAALEEELKAAQLVKPAGIDAPVEDKLVVDKNAVKELALQESLARQQGMLEKAAELGRERANKQTQIELEAMNLVEGANIAQNERIALLKNETAEADYQRQLDDMYFFEANEEAKLLLLEESELRKNGLLADARLKEAEARLLQEDLRWQQQAEWYRNSEEGLQAHEDRKNQIMSDMGTKAMQDDAKRAKRYKDAQKQAKKDANGALADLAQNSKKAFAIKKASDIAQAVSNGYTAAGLAFKAGVESAPPQIAIAVGSAFMAASIAKTAMTIRGIASTTFGGGGGGSVSAGGGGGGGGSVAAAAPIQPQAPEERSEAPQTINVAVDGSIDPESARRIIEAINEATEDGLEINALVTT